MSPVKLRPDQLSGQLASGLLPVYIVSGNEPLLVDEAVGLIRDRATAAGVGPVTTLFVERHVDWWAVRADFGSPSLFSPGNLLVLRLSTLTPGDEAARHLRGMAGRPSDGNVLLVVMPKPMQRTEQAAWFRALAQAGAWVDTRPPSAADMPRWVAQRLRKAGLGCADDALEVLVSRVEGNLLACQQEIDKLALIHPPGTVLSLEQVREAVADGARFDVFQLGEAALAGDLARAQRILASLEEEGVTAPLALWSLVREATTLVDAGARVACGEPTARALTGAGVRAWRTEPYARALARRQPGTLSRLLRMARHADEVVKGARRGDPWGGLGELAAAIAGHAGPAAILASEEDR